MKLDTKKVALSMLSSLVLIVIGYATHNTFLNFSIEQLNLQNVSLNSTGFVRGNPNLYIGALASIPLLYLLIRKLIDLKNGSQSVFIFASILILAFIFWLARLSQLDELFEKASRYTIGRSINHTFNMSELYLELYVALGILVGALSSFVLLKFNSITTK